MHSCRVYVASITYVRSWGALSCQGVPPVKAAYAAALRACAKGAEWERGTQLLDNYLEVRRRTTKLNSWMPWAISYMCCPPGIASAHPLCRLLPVSTFVFPRGLHPLTHCMVHQPLKIGISTIYCTVCMASTSACCAGRSGWHSFSVRVAGLPVYF